jgi:hypothetical protein
MADPNPTVGELFKAKAVTDEQVNASVEVYLADPRTTANPVADGYILDPAAAIAGHRGASQVVHIIRSRRLKSAPFPCTDSLKNLRTITKLPRHRPVGRKSTERRIQQKTRILDI